MLFVLFHLGQERYALEASRVVEVVPLLALKKFPQSPRGVAGMFIYRGRPVPALDLCELTTGRSAAEHISTRILIVNYAESTNRQHLIGLIAERATDILRRDPKDFVDAGVKLAAAPFLGPVLVDERGVIQLLLAHKLLGESLRDLVFTHTMEAANAGD